MKTAEVLRRAAHVVLERGLAKKTLESESGEVCAIGAVGIAATGSSMGDATTHDWWMWEASILNWNDADETTADDVASLLYSEAEVIK
jgi:hypothetical protein